MSTAAEERAGSISQAPSLDGPAQNKSWESVKEMLEDAFVADSTTELSQSVLLVNQHGNTVRLIALLRGPLAILPTHEKVVLFYRHALGN